MNEAQTAFDYIDPALTKAGWGRTENTRLLKEYPVSQGRLIGQGRRNAALKADYVLQYKNINLAVLEAKSTEQSYTEGVSQAKDYAQRLDVKFAYTTNGHRFYEINMADGTEGEIQQLPTPDELWERTFPGPASEEEQEIANWRERLFAVPFEDKGGTWQPRYFQDKAISRVLEAVAQKQHRILLTLATGTGKTAIAFQIVWKLFYSNWNVNRDAQRKPRILFLADRNVLADQAFNAFSAFEGNALVRIRPDEIKKNGKVPKNGSIFFTIFQTFMSGPDQEPHFGQYPPDFFDFVIIDECHRGGAKDESSWRAIMDYFSPAVQLGLTATPKRNENGDTYEYFGEPVYTYSLKDGINDGYLTPFRVKDFSTTIDQYTYTNEDEILEGDVQEGDKFVEPDFNRKIKIDERDEFRVELLLNHMNQTKKTLVFCDNQEHASTVRDLINQHKASDNPNYCHRVTADDGAIGEQHLKDFQDNEKTIPTVLTTSHKLSTGVDAPETRNIVLMRSIKSMVEFKQIIGRGTRLFDGKDYFTIYDFVKAHEHFNDPEWDGPPEPPEEPKPCPKCGQRPCVCEKEPQPCDVCGEDPCICEKPPKQMIKVKLSENHYRQLDAMVQTSFWSPEGKPISASEFIQRLFGDLPDLFQNEQELREIWSKPDTRKRLIQELEDKGYTHAQLEELRNLVQAEDSDLYDVLAYIAYHRELVPRAERAEKARIHLENYDPAQQDFLNFVLEQYVNAGISELDDENLGKLLTLKYNALADARQQLGDIQTIRNTFIGFQQYLYAGEVG